MLRQRNYLLFPVRDLLHTQSVHSSHSVTLTTEIFTDDASKTILVRRNRIMQLFFGIAFVFPLFLVALNLLGVLSGRAILKPWRLAVFLCFVFTAAFTPTPDPITMTLLAIPLCILYFASGLFALIVDKRRNRKSSDNTGSSVIEKPEKI